MNKKMFFILSVVLLVVFAGCKKKNIVDDTKPGAITIVKTIDKNLVTYTATAENAVSYNWDLGNGETPSGATVTGTYSFSGEYDVICTAVGREANTDTTIVVNVPDGDPDIFSDII